jgi:cold-inducible RNA-binding protein
MGSKLYVGNLESTVTDADLQTLFETVAPVRSAKVITDRMSGQSRGFGFVEMGSAEDASKAIEELNGKTLKDQTIMVAEAREQRDRSERGGFRGGGGGGRRFDRGGGGGRGRGHSGSGGGRSRW